MECPGSRRIIAGCGGARDVNVAVFINCNRVGPLVVTKATAAEVSGVGEHRIDDERPGRVVSGEPKADPLRAFAHVAPGDILPDAVDLLIDDGLVLAYVAAFRVQHEIAFSADLQFVRTFEVERDLLRVRTRCDDEVVFELALVAVVDEVDAGIDVLVTDLRVGRDIGAPLRRIFADEVVRLSRLLIEAAHHGFTRRAHEAHSQRDGLYGRLCVVFRIRIGFRQHQHGFA